MNKSRICLLLALIILPFVSLGQNGLTKVNLQPKAVVSDQQNESKTNSEPLEEDKPLGLDRFSMTTGLGINYGGIGVGFIYYPQRNIGMYGVLGVPYGDFTYVAGLKIRLVGQGEPPDANTYFICQYGVNGGVIVRNKHDLDKYFYGMALGFGLDWRAKFLKGAYLSAGVYYPFSVEEDIDLYIEEIKRRHYLENEKTTRLPAYFSFGITVPL